MCVCVHVYIYYGPKARIVAGLDAAIARQWSSKHIFAVMNQHVTKDELSEVLFSMLSVPRLCI